jgi:hypothetical protein
MLARARPSGLNWSQAGLTTRPRVARGTGRGSMTRATAARRVIAMTAVSRPSRLCRVPARERPGASRAPAGAQRWVSADFRGH